MNERGTRGLLKRNIQKNANLIPILQFYFAIMIGPIDADAALARLAMEEEGCNSKSGMLTAAVA